MKKILSLILVFAMMLSCMTITVFADSGINVTIDGEAKTFDVMPVIEDSRTLVPMRGIFEALGAEITWDDATRTVTGTKGDTTVVLQIGNTSAKVNGNDVTLDVPAKIISSRTMVPIRFVSESLGCKVDWDDNTKTVIINSPADETVNLDGKKVIFIGNSHTYRGFTVVGNGLSGVLTQSGRCNDTGYFYQLCKANGAEVSVTNWTYGNHGLGSLFGAPCNVKGDCKDIKHEEYLTDRFYDYVIVTPGVGQKSEKELIDNFKYIIEFFRSANPDVKFVCLGNASVYGCNASDTAYPGITGNYKTLEEMGVVIADWGVIVNDIIKGNCEVPGAIQTYSKSSFIVSDQYHPNVLAGYITTLVAYCAITGESAIGQPYEFYNDTSLNKHFDIPAYINKYYTNGDNDTNAAKIFESESDMKGIQQLVDEYLKAKPYRQATES